MAIGKLIPPLTLGTLCVVIYMLSLGDVDFYTKGQPREATVVWEIYNNGNWVLPLRNGHIIPSKPPLFHWLGAAASYVFGGLSEFSIRFPSALLALIGVIVTYRVGAGLWGREAGLAAGLSLATSFEWVRAAATARVDMTLTFFFIMALYMFWDIYRTRKVTLSRSLALFILFALATLAKGPIGAVLPALIIIVFLVLKGDLAFVKRLHLVSGTLLFLTVVLSWYGLALWEGGAAFFEKQIMKENVLRFLSSGAAGAGHVHPFYYFVPNLFLGMMPWSFFLPSLIYFLYHRRSSWKQSDVTFLLVWVATVFLFYSASSSKRSVYILPLYPGIALLFGFFWQALRHSADELPPRVMTLFRGGIYLILIMAALSLAVVIGQNAGFNLLDLVRPLMHPRDQTNLALFDTVHQQNPLSFSSLALGLSVALVVSFLALWARSWTTVMAGIVAFSTSFFLFVGGIILPAIAVARSFKPFMERVEARTQASPLYFFQSFDSGALYYADRRIPFYVPLATPKRPYFILLWEEKWEQLMAGGAAKGARLIDKSKGTGPKGNHRLYLAEIPAKVTLPEWGDDLRGGINKDAM